MVLIYIGLFIGLSNTIVLYITFLNAYFNNYKILVIINQYNEALIEFIALPIMFIFLIIALYKIYKLL